MKHKICLHGLDVKNKPQLIGLVKRFLPACTIKYKLKEKYFGDNDMYKCTRARFVTSAPLPYKVSVLWGVLLVGDVPMQIADVIVEFECRTQGVQAAVGMFLQKLLASKQDFVLEDPDLSARIDQLRGCYNLHEQKNYDVDDVRTALVYHLPWQFFAVSKSWGELLRKGAGSQLLRQTRVKTRRLRSIISLLKPLMPRAFYKEWQALLRMRTNVLSVAREYDVMLQICAKINMHQEEKDATNLSTALQALRTKEADKLLKNTKVNVVTSELAKILLGVYCLPPLREERHLLSFFRNRFLKWSEKLLAHSEQGFSMQDMEELHQLRIKLKRFRYAAQSSPEVELPPSMLRSLKYLQDTLGFLHDDYINSAILEGLVQKPKVATALRYEIALFDGWKQAKVDVAIELLPKQWEAFCEELSRWREEL